MALPGHRHTSSKGRRRRSHDSLKKKNLVACPKCGSLKPPHKACLDCGTYGDRKVL